MSWLSCHSVQLHRGMAAVWLLLAIPSLLWWKTSVLWVIVISLYANVAAHLAGAEGAKADRAAKENAQP
jgi:hypothetical protein